MAQQLYRAQALAVIIANAAGQTLARVHVEDAELEQLTQSPRDPTQPPTGAMILRGTIDGVSVEWLIPRSS